MLFHLLFPLADSFAPFNVIQYLTFRTGGAVLTSLIMAFLLGPTLIHWLKSKQANGQPIRDDGPANHILTKQGTPTMGGVLLLLSLGTGTLLWADLTNQYVWATLLVTFGFGGVGFVDDYLKVTRASQHGLPASAKIVIEVALAALVAAWISNISPAELSTGLAMPFIKDFLVPLGWFFVPFAAAGNGWGVELGEPDRRPRRPGHRPGDDRRLFLRLDRLSGRKCGVRRLPPDQPDSGLRRAGGVLRRPGRRRPGLPVVQRATGNAVYGRYRQPCPWAAPWARSASSPSTSLCWSSSAACSFWKPFR